VAAAKAGLLGDYAIEPQLGERSVARLELAQGTDPVLAEQYGAVFSRRTNRQVGSPDTLNAGEIASLEAAVTNVRARLRTFTDASARRNIAALLAESDRIRFLSPTLHYEMMGELRWPPRDRLDRGLDVRTLCLDPTDLSKLRVARRGDVMECLAAWSLGNALGETTLDRVTRSSAVLVLTVEGTEPADYVRGGIALQQCWLTAEQMGIGLQPVSPVFLYALDHHDVASLVPEAFRHPLQTLKAQFKEVTRLAPAETLVLVLRATRAQSPAVRSQRLTLADVMTSPAAFPTDVFERHSG
jgi:hypothetical protein